MIVVAGNIYYWDAKYCLYVCWHKDFKTTWSLTPDEMRAEIVFASIYDQEFIDESPDYSNCPF